MNFSFSEEQTILRDSIQKFILDEYEFEKRRSSLKQHGASNPQFWQTFAELGWLHLPFSEDVGGIGGSAIDTMVVMEEFGKGLVTEPYMANVLLAGRAIERCGTMQQKEVHLTALMEGKQQYALAYSENKAGFSTENIQSVAQLDGDNWALSGDKDVVLNAENADYLLVSAKDNTDQQIKLFLVAKGAKGLSKQSYQTVDDFDASSISFNQTPAELLGGAVSHHEQLEHVLAEATLALCAQACGIMESLYQSTVEYCKTRKQFGIPIASFQVLQHRMVEMFMEHEMSKSLLLMAAITMSQTEDLNEKKKAASALKAQIGKSAKYAAQQSVQLHGGMGMTDELAVGHYFKRLTMIEILFGNRDHHLREYMALSA